MKVKTVDDEAAGKDVESDSTKEYVEESTV
jgi:hypothetical protein